MEWQKSDCHPFERVFMRNMSMRRLLVVVSLFLILPSSAKSGKKPYTCSESDAEWVLIMQVTDVKPTGIKRDFDCGKKEEKRADLAFVKRLKGNKDYPFERGWTELFEDYLWEKSGCKIYEPPGFEIGKKYKLHFEIKGFPPVPACCNCLDSIEYVEAKE